MGSTGMNKRRKATEACMNCRRYKAKCNEYRPCDRCVEKEQSRCEDFAAVSARSLSTIRATLSLPQTSPEEGRTEQRRIARPASAAADRSQLIASAGGGGGRSEQAAASGRAEDQVRGI